ncbi:12447_t:CDS:2 [Acaulospora morrowiae]|uniref:12447_t:CDS:1 n=1 Tax=Acaulospora morrowiae TaxID=94023 RepID=A0A9N9BBA9_9GLOM|nr:12447_t:CDS:2 [Acaulospora morrowiae]
MFQQILEAVIMFRALKDDEKSPDDYVSEENSTLRGFSSVARSALTTPEHEAISLSTSTDVIDTMKAVLSTVAKVMVKASSSIGALNNFLSSPNVQVALMTENGSSNSAMIDCINNNQGDFQDNIRIMKYELTNSLKNCVQNRERLMRSRSYIIPILLTATAMLGTAMFGTAMLGTAMFGTSIFGMGYSSNLISFICTIAILGIVIIISDYYDRKLEQDINKLQSTINDLDKLSRTLTNLEVVPRAFEIFNETTEIKRVFAEYQEQIKEHARTLRCDCADWN